jgi:hypothetical protein
MSTHSGNRRPAARLNGRTLRLGLEALEPRCVCATRVAVVEPLTPPPFEAQAAAKIGQTEFALSGRISVAEYRAEVADLKLTAGVTFTGPVAHMVAGDKDLDAIDVTHMGVRIDWGNGQSTTGAVQIGTHGGYDIVATARYSTPGNYVLTIDIAGPDGAEATAIGKVEVVAAPPVAGHTPESADIDVRNSDNPPAPQQPDQTQGTTGSDMAATQAASRTPGDTNSGVPWVRLPDPGPLSTASAVTDHPVDHVVVAIVPPEDRPPANGLADDGHLPPVGPTYLAAVDEPGDGFPAADFTPIDVRPGIPQQNAAAVTAVVDLPVLMLPDPAQSTGPGRAAPVNRVAAVVGANGSSVEDVDGGAVPLASTTPAPVQHAKRGFWWQSLSWFLALVFSDRVLTVGMADRSKARISLRVSPATKPTEAENAGDE